MDSKLIPLFKRLKELVIEAKVPNKLYSWGLVETYNERVLLLNLDQHIQMAESEERFKWAQLDSRRRYWKTFVDKTNELCPKIWNEFKGNEELREELKKYLGRE